MDTVETMVLNKLRAYREQANRDRFILPDEHVRSTSVLAFYDFQYCKYLIMMNEHIITFYEHMMIFYEHIITFYEHKMFIKIFFLL
jgi:hypothetical protein